MQRLRGRGSIKHPGRWSLRLACHLKTRSVPVAVLLGRSTAEVPSVSNATLVHIPGSQYATSIASRQVASCSAVSVQVSVVRWVLAVASRTSRKSSRWTQATRAEHTSKQALKKQIYHISSIGAARPCCCSKQSAGIRYESLRKAGYGSSEIDLYSNGFLARSCAMRPFPVAIPASVQSWSMCPCSSELELPCQAA